MRPSRDNLALLVAVLIVAVPAHANNPPGLDGLLSVLLLIPLVIVGWRLAHVPAEKISRTEHIVVGVVVGFSFLLMMAGTGLALIGMVVFLCYGIMRGQAIMRHGKGGRRFALGALVILYTFVALADYSVSLASGSRPRWDGYAQSTLRSIVSAEVAFKEGGQSVARDRYGSLEELVKEDLIGPNLAQGTYHHYRFVVVLGQDAKGLPTYFAYALPLQYSPRSESVSVLEVIPGGSLIGIFLPRREVAQYAFAADESGTLRRMDLGRTVESVTREEIAKWPEVE